MRLTSHRFACHQCGAELNTNLGRFLLAPAITAAPLGFAISKALDDPAWWIGVVVTMGGFLLVGYWLFSVRAAPDRSGAESVG